MDIETIKKAADEYKTKFEEAETKAQKEIETLKFNHAIENALGTAKAKNAKAVKALLNLDGLKLNGEEVVGLKEQIEALKTDNDYLFGEVVPPGTGGSLGGGARGKLDTPPENYGANLAKSTPKVVAPQVNPYEL